VRDENGEMLADSYNILNSWKNYHFQLLNVSDVRQIEIHTAEPLGSDSSPSEVETAISKLKKYKSLGSDQILAKLIQAGGGTLWSEIHKLVNFIWNKKELPDQWKGSIIVPIYKKGNKTDCSNHCGISLLSTLYKILFNILPSKLSPYVDEIIEDHKCEFQHNRSTTGHIF
jgi:hypothetical protein